MTAPFLAVLRASIIGQPALIPSFRDSWPGLINRLQLPSVAQMRSLVLSPLIGALLFVCGIAAGALLPYGEQAGDQLIPFSHTGSNAFALSVPVPYYEEPQSEVFISSKGAVSFGKALPSAVTDLESEAVNAIAVLYAAANNGLVYYRKEPKNSDTALRIAEKIRKTFPDVGNFEPKVVIVVTWDRLTTADAPGENAFQLVLLSDARTSYALLNFDRIEWTKANNQYAQSGFYFKDGRNQKNVNAGTDNVSDFVRLTNHDSQGSFLFRISGPFTVDPRDNAAPEDEYEYESAPDYDQDFAAGGNGDCPPNPFHGNCPVHCQEVSDDRHCKLCICPDREPSQRDVDNELGDEVALPDKPPIDESTLNVSPPEHPEVDLPKQPELNDVTNEELPPYQPPSNNIDIPQPPPNEEYLPEERGDEIPPPAPEQPYEPEQPQQPQPLGNPTRPVNGSCASVASSPIPACNRFAICQDFDTGFCCHCSAEFIGNGIDCIKANDPVRVLGTFEGAINGQPIEKADFHAFVQTKDGQQHTGVARVPLAIAPALLYLDSIGNIIGWLFATQGSENAYNGFDLTGGVLNRTVSIHLGDRYALLIKQDFLGRKADQDFITANVFVSGTLPEISPDGQIEYANFVDTYRRERPGFLRAYTEREITVRENGAERKLRVTVDQQIHYTECKHNAQDKSEVLKIRVSRASAQYDKDQNVVRFASQNAAIDPNDEPAGPAQRGPVAAGTPNQPGHAANVDQGVCATGTHLCTEQHMLCQPAEQSYRCICEDGFHPQNDESVILKFRCVPAPVHANVPAPVAAAETPIGPGFCTSHSECHQWGECVQAAGGKGGSCKCRGWYVGDGVTHCGPPEPEQPQVPQHPQHPQQPQQYQPQVPQHVDASPTVGTVCRAHSECSEHGNCVYSQSLGYYTCECVAPYKGDGIQCYADSDGSVVPQPIAPVQPYQPQEPIVRPPSATTECTDQRDCHTNAHCIKADASDRYFCECLDGFNGDGVRQCVPSDRCDPSTPNSCPAFSECTYGSIEQSYVCKCIQGYTGDGQVCIIQPPVVPNGCDRDPSQCHANAQCEFDLKLARYECRCKPGSTGDGYRSCVLDSGCFENRDICDRNAQCLPGESGRYVCNCNFGFHGNGLVCHPDTDQRPDTLLIGRGMSVIQRSTAREIMGRQLVVVPHQVVVDLDYDCTSERVYWSDISGHAIRSATINGTDVTTYFVQDLSSPEGIAIDWSSRNLYYVDSGKNAHIGVASLDGRFRRTLLKEGLTNPRALEIDPVERKLYYSDWNRNNPHIGRVDLDGRNNEVFINTDIHLPNGLAIIQATRELCWVDAGSQRLSCIGLEHRNRRLVYAPLEYPFGLAIRNDERFYWTDWKDHQIHTVSISGQGYASFSPTMGGGGKVYGIISVPKKCTGGTTPCAVNNGGCDYLCLPSARDSVDCVCPDNTVGLDGC
uniref:Nidogen n=1 Tax=Panagrellus redivivus TaxID=6233 RepID=A0A7E4W1P9_PANRE